MEAGDIGGRVGSHRIVAAQEAPPMVHYNEYEQGAWPRRAIVAATALSALVTVSLWKPIVEGRAGRHPAPTSSLAVGSQTRASGRSWDVTWLQHRSAAASAGQLPLLFDSSAVDWPAGSRYAPLPFGRSAGPEATHPLFRQSLVPAVSWKSGILTGLPEVATAKEMSARMLAGLELGANRSPASDPRGILPPLPLTKQQAQVARLSRQVGLWLVGKRESSALSARQPITYSDWVAPIRLKSIDERLAFVPRELKVASLPSSKTDSSRGLHQWIEGQVSRQIERRAEESWLPRPQSLVRELQQLVCEEESSLWAAEVLRALEFADNRVATGPSDTRQNVERLASLADTGQRLAESVEDQGLAVRIRQATYSLWRRAECWYAATEVLLPPAERIALASNSVSVLKRVVRKADIESAPVERLSAREVNNLLTAVERYESKGLVADSQHIALALDRLAMADDPRQRRLAESLEGNYRNANLRVALSHELIERWLPQEVTTTRPVSDRILGTPVEGVAKVTTGTKVQLVPDQGAWRLVLLARGDIHSSTTARQGSVRVRSLGTSQFVVNQQLVIDSYGVRRGEARANAVTATRLVGTSSQYDGVPLVGSIVRSKARDAFYDRQGAAAREAQTKTAEQARSDFDFQVSEALARVEAEYEAKVLRRLESAGVALEPVEWKTTSSRLIGRVRLSQEGLLTAHTPRPRAPSDSVASLQLHESGLRSLAASLQLDGQRLSTTELSARLQSLRGDGATRELASEGEAAIIEFAPERALDVKLEKGRVHLTIDVRELSVRNSSVRNFKVHTYYTPEVDGLLVTLRPTEGPHFEGSLRNRERMQLHAIFGKGRKNRTGIELGRQWFSDPRLEGLAITQLVIDDGWLGVAVGPQSPHHTAQVDRYRPMR